MIVSGNISNLNNTAYILIFFFFFSGGFQSLKHIWLVGGNFLTSTMNYLQVLRNMNDEGREKAPLFDSFDFEIFTSSATNNILRLQQALSNALSTCGYLPSVILLLLDHEIFSTAELYLPSEIESQLRWIFSQVTNMIKERKRESPERSFRCGEPLIYVMKILPRFDNGTDPNYLLFADRVEKFNTLLQAIARCYAIGTVNVQNINPDDSRLFDRKTGKELDSSGHYRLWRELLSTLYEITKDQERAKRHRIFQEESAKRKPTPERRRHNDYSRY